MNREGQSLAPMAGRRESGKTQEGAVREEGGTQAARGTGSPEGAMLPVGGLPWLVDCSLQSLPSLSPGLLPSNGVLSSPLLTRTQVRGFRACPVPI